MDILNNSIFDHIYFTVSHHLLFHLKLHTKLRPEAYKVSTRRSRDFFLSYTRNLNKYKAFKIQVIPPINRQISLHYLEHSMVTPVNKLPPYLSQVYTSSQCCTGSNSLQYHHRCFGIHL